jgi:hypothetical protein
MNKWTGLRLSTKEMGEAAWAHRPVFSDLLTGPTYSDLIHRSELIHVGIWYSSHKIGPLMPARPWSPQVMKLTPDV